MLKKLKKIIIVFLVISITLIQFSNLIYAINENIKTTAWDVKENSTVQLGISFKQNDQKYYKMTYTKNGGDTTQKTRAIYRTYCTSSGSDKDFSKNIFCIDIDGKFPNETDVGNVAHEGGNVTYTSKGDVLITTTNIELSKSNKLDATKVGKVLAILNSGYDYSTFENESSGFLKWLDDIIEKYDKSDDAPSGQEMLDDGTLTVDKIFLLEQIAIWEVTNDIKLTNLYSTSSTPTGLSDGGWNPAQEETQRQAEAAILNYFRGVASNITDYLPKSSASPEFQDTQKTTTYSGNYAYIGPFNLKNSSNLQTSEIIGVKADNTETKISTGYTIVKSNSGTDNFQNGIKGTNGQNFYIRLPKTAISPYTKLKIKVTAKLRKMTLWENGSSDSQKLISMTEETPEDEDEATIEKPKYDVALRKYIVKINGEEITTKGEASRVPTVEASKASDTFNNQDFQYKHKKDPVKVHIGDKVTYKITLYNECEHDLKIHGVRDYLPDGLDLDKSNGNSNTSWTASSSSNAGEKYATYNGSDITLNAMTTVDGVKHVTTKDIEITCVVKENVTPDRILTNVAEIVEVQDKDGYKQIQGNNEDDSTGGNLNNGKNCADTYSGNSGNSTLTNSSFYYYGEEDDDDFEKLIVEIKGKYKVDLEKVNESGEKITEGQATFKVTSVNENNKEETKTTNQGTVTLVDEKDILNYNTQDEYKVEEVSAPTGYTKTNQVLHLKLFKSVSDKNLAISKIEAYVDNNESNKSTITGSEVEVGDYKVSISNGTILIKVKNTKITGSYDLELEKVDEKGTLLEGQSTFKIGELNNQNTTKGKLSIATNKAITDIANPDEYIIEEITAPTGYKKLDKKITVKVHKKQDGNTYKVEKVEVLVEGEDTKTVTGSGTESTSSYDVSLNGNKITIKVKNKKIEGNYNLNLEKVDDNWQTIKSGEATFKVDNESKNTVEGILKIAESKPITNTNDDEYTISEEQAPTGYAKFDGTIKVKVKKEIEGSTYKVSSISVTVSGNGTEQTINNGDTDREIGNIKVSLNNNVITIKVKNKKIEGSYNLNLEKVNDNWQTITDGVATFKVGSENKNTESGIVKVAENKQITDTKEDTYVISEEQAPSGYVKFNGTITVKVKKQIDGSTYKVSSVSVTVSGNGEEQTINDGDSEVEIGDIKVSLKSNVITIKVKNKKLEGSYSIDLIKTDEKGNTVNKGEATFKINEDQHTTQNGILKVVTDKKITDIDKADSYEIEEITPPTGYKKFDGKLKLTVNKTSEGENYKVSNLSAEIVDSGKSETIQNGEEKEIGSFTVSLKDNVIIIKVKNERLKYDVALRKYITKINGVPITELGLKSRNPEVKNQNTGFNSPDFRYEHRKDPIKVKVGDRVTYEIRVYNECENIVKITGIRDFLPKGLELEPNSEWTLSTGENGERSAFISKGDTWTLGPLTKTESGTNMKSFSIEITCIVTEDAKPGDILTNVAEITGVTDELGNEQVEGDNEDDSTGGNLSDDAKKCEDDYRGGSSGNTLDDSTYYYYGEEDDDDFEKLIIEENGFYNLNLQKIDENGELITSREATFRINDKTESTTSGGKLSIASNIEIKDTETIDEYIIEEIKAPSGYEIISKKLIIKISKEEVNGKYGISNIELVVDGIESKTLDKENGTNIENYEVSLQNGTILVKVKNKKLEGKYSINLEKIDEEGNLIQEEATFKINNQNEGKTTGGKLEIAKDIEIKDVSTIDKYIVEEIIAPSGYEKLNEKLILQISKTQDVGTYKISNIELFIDGDTASQSINEGGLVRVGSYEVSLNNNVISIRVTNKKVKGNFDLALQKFITKIDDKEITERAPLVTYEDGQIKYAHPQDAVIVVNGNKVTYTIRVYNEGDVAGFPSMVKDDLPNGITFLKDSETNKTYGWKMYKASENGEVTIGGKKYTEVQELSEAEIIATDYYSYEKATARGEKAIQPFDASKGTDGTNPDYRDLKVEFEVTAKNVAAENRIITNTAEIADDEDENGNPVEDIDSEPNNDKDGEDDIDKERLQLKYFDLSLLKYVSEVEVTEDGKKKTIKTDYDGTENPEPIVKVEIDKKKLNKTEVKYTFTIKITNEGEIEGYATEITDYIPSGLEFKTADNKEYKWKLKDGSKDVVTTDYLKDTLLKPGESATIKIVLRWKKSEKNLGQKINTAEISEDKNEYNAPDIDSTPDNKKDGEDDIDDAPVILSIKTGGTEVYIILIISVITILSSGIFIIYKYVYCYQEEKMYISNAYKNYRRKF